MKTRPGICQRKRRFSTREEAERVAALAPFTLRAYTCALCREFHLTSRTKGMKTPRHELER
ncbi:MAG: hypothetical protein V2I27_10580 [Erythrobacter sp.]|jgi:hypothetical protein|nr:hypothetical protein [Erythrobacter sp.]